MTRRGGGGAAVGLLIAAMCSRSMAIDPSKPGDLRVEVAVSPSPEYVKQWVRTPSYNPVTIERLHELKKGHVAYVAFIVTGWGPDHTSASEVNLEVDCRIFNPDGSVLFDLPNYAKYEGRPGGPGFVMADPALDLHIDKEDQVGAYRITATVREKASGRSAKGEYSFLVRE